MDQSEMIRNDKSVAVRQDAKPQIVEIRAPAPPDPALQAKLARIRAAFAALPRVRAKGQSEECRGTAREMARERLKAMGIEGDAGLTRRLLEETRTQMADNESAHRRNLFARLRAAVMARGADSSLKSTASVTEARTEDFRATYAGTAKPSGLTVAARKVRKTETFES